MHLYRQNEFYKKLQGQEIQKSILCFKRDDIQRYFEQVINIKQAHLNAKHML